MPSGLRFVKGSPPRTPSMAEAHQIAEARATLLVRHGLENHYPDAPAICQRFAELLDSQDRRLPANQR